MIVIDGKAHRNMPEQVAKNQKDIEDIFNTLDGLNIQDNVVAIADLSHMLTQDELEIVERAVAFIVYNDHLFIKRDQDTTNAYFDIVFSISGSTVISFNSDEMQVNLTTGALTLVSNTFATYSKTELDTQLGAKASVFYVDTQLASKADLSGADFTGAITAPSISQTAPTWSADFTLTAQTGISVDIKYNKFEVIGNVLYIIVNFKITNISGADIYVQTLDKSVAMPSNIANKIIDIEGNSVAESSVTNDCLIAGDTCLSVLNSSQYSSVKYDGWNIFIANRTLANTCQVFIHRASSTLLHANDFVNITGRIALSLI